MVGSSVGTAGSLAHYEQVSLYETAFKSRREDVAFFRRLAAKTGGPILEYGAGTGRITLPLLRDGHGVTAVDASAPMLDRLEARLSQAPRRVATRAELRLGDMRKLKLTRSFPLVLATFNVVGHLESFRDMGRFLRRARQHLAEGGTLAFDVPIPHPDEIEADPDEPFVAPRFKHPDTGEWIRQTERFIYDPERQLLRIESTFCVEGTQQSLTTALVLRQWFPKEIEALLIYEGFSQIETYADYSDQPGLLARDTLVFVARA